MNTDILESDNRNVADHYKGRSNEDIIADMEAKRLNYSILIDNRTKNLNAGTIVRNANAFLAKQVIFYGRRNYNRVPCVGSYIYVNIEVAHNLNELNSLIQKGGISQIVGIDNNLDKPTIDINDYVWRSDTHYLLCFGNEADGLGDEISELCSEFVEIKTFGTIRSLNLSNAAAIILHDYCRKTSNPFPNSR